MVNKTEKYEQLLVDIFGHMMAVGNGNSKHTYSDKWPDEEDFQREFQEFNQRFQQIRVSSDD